MLPASIASPRAVLAVLGRRDEATEGRDDVAVCGRGFIGVTACMLDGIRDPSVGVCEGVSVSIRSSSGGMAVGRGRAGASASTSAVRSMCTT